MKRLKHLYDVGSKFSIACEGKGVGGEFMNVIKTGKIAEVSCKKCIKASEKAKPLGSITIQPDSPKHDHLKMPYPYHINRNGLVGRQDFWGGKPYKLIGFCNKPKAGKVDLDLGAFLSVPVQAVGLYPVFSDKKDNWYTETVKIIAVHSN